MTRLLQVARPMSSMLLLTASLTSTMCSRSCPSSVRTQPFPWQPKEQNYGPTTRHFLTCSVGHCCAGTYCEPADDYCPGSPMQLCRSMCPSPEAIRTQNGCAADACLTRSGSCCDLSCESSGGSSSSGACAQLLATARFALGATIPTCADDGSYAPQQCRCLSTF